METVFGSAKVGCATEKNPSKSRGKCKRKLTKSERQSAMQKSEDAIFGRGNSRQFIF
jgi:hypothetical protein